MKEIQKMLAELNKKYEEFQEDGSVEEELKAMKEKVAVLTGCEVVLGKDFKYSIRL